MDDIETFEGLDKLNINDLSEVLKAKRNKLYELQCEKMILISNILCIQGLTNIEQQDD